MIICDNISAVFDLFSVIVSRFFEQPNRLSVWEQHLMADLIWMSCSQIVAGLTIHLPYMSFAISGSHDFAALNSSIEVCSMLPMTERIKYIQTDLIRIPLVHFEYHSNQPLAIL